MRFSELIVDGCGPCPTQHSTTPNDQSAAFPEGPALQTAIHGAAQQALLVLGRPATDLIVHVATTCLVQAISTNTPDVMLVHWRRLFAAGDPEYLWTFIGPAPLELSVAQVMAVTVALVQCQQSAGSGTCLGTLPRLFKSAFVVRLSELQGTHPALVSRLSALVQCGPVDDAPMPGATQAE